MPSNTRLQVSEVLSVIIFTYELAKLSSSSSLKVQVALGEIIQPGPTTMSSLVGQRRPWDGGEPKERKTRMSDTPGPRHRLRGQPQPLRACNILHVHAKHAGPHPGQGQTDL